MWFEKDRSNSRHHYAPLDPQRDDQPQQPLRTTNGPSWLYMVAAGVTVTIVAIFSFVAGIAFARYDKHGRPNLPTIRKTLQPDTSFMVKPPKSNDHTWDSMFPTTGTFFPHPDIAPERGTLSVFHQLHCLNAIRHIHWATVEPTRSRRDGAGPGDPVFDKWHMNHCIELLRQSLMCTPDLTLEVTNKTLGGVTGFGTEHICVDWGSLLEWVEDTEENAVDKKVTTHP